MSPGEIIGGVFAISLVVLLFAPLVVACIRVCIDIWRM